MTNAGELISEESLAHTYNGGAYSDAWEVVQQYRDVTKHQSYHPNKGSSAIASALDLPRSRIRTWTDGGAPDVVRGIETARDYGWIENTYEDSTFTGLNSLVANVFSGGSIAEQYYRPSFALNARGHDSHIFDALELVDVEYDVVEDREGRADEVRPTTDATVLGRVLVSLGAPIGPKTGQHLTLPEYLDDAPRETRETFVVCYLENRGIEHEQKATLTIQEDRNQTYIEELARLIRSVSDGPVTVGEGRITISADAARSLGTVR